MEIPALKDCIQEFGKPINDIPEIRVWCHPHKIGESEDDYYQVFDSFDHAFSFIKDNKSAERVPLVAFRGYELNIFAIPKKSQLKGAEDNAVDKG